MNIYEQLAHHFARHDHVTKVTTGQVRIGTQTYPAARYTEVCQNAPGTRAYAECQRSYTREIIYCVGDLPSAKRRGNVAFTLYGDDRDWYVAAYYGQLDGRVQRQAEPNEFHPFGNSFMLAPWDLADSKIDTYEKVPYRRMPIRLGKAWVARKG